MASLDDVLSKYLEWEHRDYEETAAAIREGYDDMQSGRMRPIEESFEALRVKQGLPR